jgi:hypothetical protein
MHNALTSLYADACEMSCTKKYISATMERVSAVEVDVTQMEAGRESGSKLSEVSVLG